jgi:hypothetical protein
MSQDRDILSELKRKKRRDLTSDEMAAIAKLFLAERFGHAELLKSKRGRLKAVEKACRKVRRKAARRQRAPRIV